MLDRGVSDKKNYKSGNRLYKVIKRIIDLIICLMLFPLFVTISCILLFLNIFFNKGKIYFIQKRMGMHCKPFYAIKFRSMKSVDQIIRKYSDPLENRRTSSDIKRD